MRPISSLSCVLLVSLGTISCSSSPDSAASAAPDSTVISAPGTTQPPSIETERPVVGQCHPGSQVVKNGLLDPDSAMDCNERHGLETWKVVDLPEPYRSNTFLPNINGGDAVRALKDLCFGDDRVAHLDTVAPVATPFGKRSESTSVGNYWFLPSPAQWARGARWVRCDVGIGLSSDDASLSTGPFKEMIKRPENEALKADCASASESVLCTEPHDVEYVSFYEANPGPWPQDDTNPVESKRWLDQCKRDVAAYIGAPVPDDMRNWISISSEGAWQAGTRNVTCYLTFRGATNEALTTTGSARGERGIRPPTS